jgi:hypothetical protein
MVSIKQGSVLLSWKYKNASVCCREAEESHLHISFPYGSDSVGTIQGLLHPVMELTVLPNNLFLPCGLYQIQITCAHQDTTHA